MSEMYSVDINNTPSSFEHVFKLINQHKCSDWRMKIDTRYSNSTEIYLVFDTHFEEITLSDEPKGDEMGLNNILEIIDGDDYEDYDEWDDEDVVEVKTETTNKIKLNSTKEMEKKTMTTQEIMNTVTIINTVNMMLGTGKTARISSKIDKKIETYIIIANADRVDERSINTKLFDSKEEIIRVALFGEEKLERIVEKETDRPVSWDALVDFATQCKDKLLEEDEHDPDNGYVDWMRENFDQSMIDFMEIPSNKLKLIKVTMKQKFEFEEELETFILVPVDEDVESYFSESDNDALDKFKDINGRNRDIICINRDANLSEDDPEFTYSTECSEKTINEILDNYDENDLLNLSSFE